MNKDNGMLWSCMCSFYYLWEAKSIWKKSKPWKQLSDVLETNSLTLMKVLKFFSEIFP